MYKNLNNKKYKRMILDSSTVVCSLFQSRLQGRILWDGSGWLCWGVGLLLLYVACSSSCRGARWPPGGAVWRGRGGGGCEGQQGSVVLLSSGEGGGGAEGGVSGADGQAVRPAVPTRWFHVDQSGRRWAHSQPQLKVYCAGFVGEQSSESEK